MQLSAKNQGKWYEIQRLSYCLSNAQNLGRSLRGIHMPKLIKRTINICVFHCTWTLPKKQKEP